MNRSSVKVLPAMLGLGLMLGVKSPIQGAASQIPDEPPFSVDTATLGKTRKIKKETRPVEPPRRHIAGTKWEIRASTGTGRLHIDCFYSIGTKRFCRDGGFAGAFESADGKHVLVYSAGPGFYHAEKKFIGVFEVDSGQKIREVTIDEGGSMAGVANAKADLFVAFYQKAGGGIVLQAFDMLGNLRWRREFEGRTTPVIGTSSIAIEGRGKRILLAAGGVLIISDTGKIVKEIPVDAGFIDLSPRKDVAIFWSRRGYQVYSISDDRMLLRQSCASGKRDWCLVKGFSQDGRLLSVVGMEESFPTDKKPRLVRVEVVDLPRHKVHRDILNEEFGSGVRAEFKADGSLEVQSTEKTISYEPVP